MLNSNNLKRFFNGFVLSVIVVLSILTIVLLLETVFTNIQRSDYFDSDLSLSQYVNPQYQYIPPLIAEKNTITIPVKLIFPNGTSTDIKFPLKTITKLVFESTALSAQNPITVYAELTFDIPKNSGIVLQDKYFMIFPFSQDLSKKRVMFEQTQGVIVLEQIDSSKFYGTGKIMYPFDGVQPFFDIMTWDELSNIRQGDTAYVSGLDLNKTIGGRDFLIIEPSSTTTILRTNIIIVALTFVVIAFGLVQIRRNYL